MTDWRNSQPPGARRLPTGQPLVGPARKTHIRTTTGARPLATYLDNAAIHETSATSTLSTKVRVSLFTILGVDVIYLLVMILIPSTDALGSFESFITWGGNLWAPFLLAVAATAGLTTVALMSAGFTDVNRNQLIAIWACVAVSAVSTGLAVASLVLIGLCLAIIMAFIVLIVGGLVSG
jgi:hypothetical protein